VIVPKGAPRVTWIGNNRQKDKIKMGNKRINVDMGFCIVEAPFNSAFHSSRSMGQKGDFNIDNPFYQALSD